MGGIQGQTGLWIRSFHSNIHQNLLTMKRIFLLSLLFSLGFVQSALAVFSIRVGNPQKGNWTFTTGTIEEALLTVRPHGLYLEYGLYLTFSARGTNTFAPTDSLEVEFKFELPDQAVVVDSWLWINDDIVRARILDAFTATGIYEQTVNRRIDPSLLRKSSNKDYELRVFPMRADQTRRVKITYLVPGTWNDKTVSAGIPVQMINPSRIKPSVMTVLCFPEGPWNTPTLSSSSNINLTTLSDPQQGIYQQAYIPSSVFNQSVSIAYPAPYKNGVYLDVYEEGGDNFYEVAVLPSAFYDAKRPKKVCMLVDYNASNTFLSTLDVMNAVRESLKGSLSASDSFNLIVAAGFSVKRARNAWIPAHPDSIQQIVDALAPDLAAYSNLALLLPNGISFVKGLGGDGDLLLVANTNQFANVAASNSFIFDIFDLLPDKDVPMHIVDHNSASSPFLNLNGIVYRGSEYLFRNLSESTGGDYYTTYNNTQTISAALSKALLGLDPNVWAFDFFTSVDNGFCFGRYNLGSVGTNITSIAQPITQLGRYSGSLPLVVQMAGIVDNEPFNTEILLNSADVVLNDSFLREMWYGQYIRSAENGQIDNGVILNVTQTSIAERVLSKYTAFLCLEDTTQFCPTCYDETGLVDVGDVRAPDSLFTAFPNPFVALVHFQAHGLEQAGAVLDIFSFDGRLILRKIVEPDARGDWNWTWNALMEKGSTLPAGVYFARLNTEHRQAVIRLVKPEVP